MSKGRKNMMRLQPYGPIAAMESSEDYDLSAHMWSLLQSHWRKLRYQLPAFALRESDEGKEAPRRGPPARLSLEG